MTLLKTGLNVWLAQGTLTQCLWVRVFTVLMEATVDVRLSAPYGNGDDCDLVIAAVVCILRTRKSKSVGGVKGKAAKKTQAKKTTKAVRV